MDDVPYAVSALRGLGVELPRMAEYHKRAVEMAELLAAKGIRTFAVRPHRNAFCLFVEAPADLVTERVITVIELERLAVTPVQVDSQDVPGWWWTEFAVGLATMEWSPGGAVDVLARVLFGLIQPGREHVVVGPGVEQPVRSGRTRVRWTSRTCSRAAMPA